MKTTLQEMLRQIRGFTLAMLDKTNPEWLTWAPEGTSNHMLWHAGHAIWVQDRLTIERLSPGDTANYTAVLSVGIDDNDAVPLIPAELLGGFLSLVNLLLEETDVVECNPNTQGDIDGNGIVNFGDFLILAQHFGQPASDHTTGDLDCSGQIVFPDFLILAQNFGSEVGTEPVTVPEPKGTLIVLLCALAAGFARRCGRG